jgi:hypothetical protein
LAINSILNQAVEAVFHVVDAGSIQVVEASLNQVVEANSIVVVEASSYQVFEASSIQVVEASSNHQVNLNDVSLACFKVGEDEVVTWTVNETEVIDLTSDGDERMNFKLNELASFAKQFVYGFQQNVRKILL